MSSVDKAAIGWSIGIAAVAVAIAFAGTSNSLPTVDTSITMPTTSTGTGGSMADQSPTMTDPFADDAAQVRQQSDMMADDMMADDMMADDMMADDMMADDMMADDMMADDMMAEDAAPAETESEPIVEVPMGPTSWDVITPQGTSVPGCELDDTCFMPSDLTVQVGDTVNWVNDDNAAHTVSSGSPADGISGVFDSGLVMAGTVFSHTFEESGTYPYYCLVHPWMIGTVVVE